MVLSVHDDDHKFFNSVRLKAMVLSRVFKQPAFIGKFNILCIPSIYNYLNTIKWIM